VQPRVAEPHEVPPPDGTFDVERFEHTVDVMLLAQEIIVGPSSYPTEEIGANARAFRQLGLGYANLGAFLMSNGMPYDSDAGRGTAAAITALMTGRAYRQSAQVAAALGPYERYEENREAHNGVMRMHRDAAYAIPDVTCEDRPLLDAARRSWDQAWSRATRSATATRRPRCWRRPGRSRSSWTATRPASSRTSRSSSSRSSSAAGR
jgi:ribonucleotide reductase alpha subunit